MLSSVTHLARALMVEPAGADLHPTSRCRRAESERQARRSRHRHRSRRRRSATVALSWPSRSRMTSNRSRPLHAHHSSTCHWLASGGRHPSIGRIVWRHNVAAGRLLRRTSHTLATAEPRCDRRKTRSFFAAAAPLLSPRTTPKRAFRIPRLVVALVVSRPLHVDAGSFDLIADGVLYLARLHACPSQDGDGLIDRGMLSGATAAAWFLA